MSPAEEHRIVAAAFSRLAWGVPAQGWDAPSPVEGWSARDIVRHLLDWLPGFIESGAGIRLTGSSSVDDDPARAWEARREEIQALLDDPATEEVTFRNRYTGDLPLDRAINRFYTSDVFLHTWDLARATGQDDTLDPVRCARLLDEIQPVDELMRTSGQFGPKVEVPPDADVQTRLIGFIGRDPFRQ